MILDCVLAAVNEVPLYRDFVPLFIKQWNKLYPETTVRIILIQEQLPEYLFEYKDNIILFPPVSGVPTKFTSQYIRLLYPALMNDIKGGIMITDMDNLPLNSTYFTDHIKDIRDDKWINYRQWTSNKNDQICMMWQIATVATWKDVFGITTIDDVKMRLKIAYKSYQFDEKSSKYNWFADQLDLFKYVMDWKKKTNRYIKLHDKNTHFNRLNRGESSSWSQTLEKDLKNGSYSDFHSLRPIQQHEELITKILDAATSSVKTLNTLSDVKSQQKQYQFLSPFHCGSNLTANIFKKIFGKNVSDGSKLIWKHTTDNRKIRRSIQNNSQLKITCLIKNPISFLISLKRIKYCMIYEEDNPNGEHWNRCFLRTNSDPRTRFENSLALWKHYLQMYTKLQEDFPKQCKLFYYEDFISDRDDFVDKLAKYNELSKTCDAKVYESTLNERSSNGSDKHKSDFHEAKNKNNMATFLTVLSREEVSLIKSYLNLNDDLNARYFAEL